MHAFSQTRRANADRGGFGAVGALSNANKRTRTYSTTKEFVFKFTPQVIESSALPSRRIAGEWEKNHVIISFFRLARLTL